jgi:hypothetical protein
LSATGSLRLWHLLVLGALYGAGTAFFDPSFDAIVPELLSADRLAQANSLDQLVRPIALRMVGPAIGGVLVDAVGTGGAFALDAASFAVSAAALVAMSAGTRPRADDHGSVGGEIAAGLTYVRRHAWLWATLVSAAIAYLLFTGPTEVLLPFIVKNQLRGSAGDLGMVFAAGGLGSLICALGIGQRGLPRRDITFMYCAWTLATFAIAGYGLAHALWGLMLASVAFNSLETAGTIAWATAKQRHVPIALLGRVSSLDWLISIGLVPLSFAMTGPVSAALGARSTLVGAGVLGGLVTLAALFVPGVRAIERRAETQNASDDLALGDRDGLRLGDPEALALALAGDHDAGNPVGPRRAAEAV